MTLSWLPARERLEVELRRAILTAYDTDEVLFGRDACERSIMFRIGRYLAPVIEEDWSGRLWVDCEYNRIAGKTTDKVKKQLVGLSENRDCKRSVFPDLIVHDRRGSSGDHNLLVVEAKKVPATPEAVAFDRLKLECYRDELAYRHAVYLELGESPQWQWIGINLELRPVADNLPSLSDKRTRRLPRST